VWEIATQLTDVEITEIALVKTGANNKQFLLFKSAPENEGGDSTMDKDELSRLMAAMKSGSSAAVEKAFELLHIEKATAEAGQATIAKELAEAVAKTETAEAEKAKVEKELAEAMEKAEEAEQEARTKEFVVKAEAFTLPGITHEDLGAVLKTVADTSPEVEANLTKILKATSAVLKDSEIFKTFGKTGEGADGSSGDDSWDQVLTKANSLVEKSGDTLTLPQAISAVLNKEPALYAKYLEKEGQ